MVDGVRYDTHPYNSVGISFSIGSCHRHQSVYAFICWNAFVPYLPTLFSRVFTWIFPLLCWLLQPQIFLNKTKWQIGAKIFCHLMGEIKTSAYQFWLNSWFLRIISLSSGSILTQFFLSFLSLSSQFVLSFSQSFPVFLSFFSVFA